VLVAVAVLVVLQVVQVVLVAVVLAVMVVTSLPIQLEQSILVAVEAQHILLVLVVLV
jgi:hypothetical protein|tara:strand:+ start:535 stop:705 length:171 start_codon:yes stop_codon:yes gene_type:complete